MSNYKEIWKKMIQKYGKIAQYDQCIEECAELIQAIQKVKRGKQKAYENLIKELADVKQMVEQVIIIADCENEVNHELDIIMTGLECDTKDVELYKLKRRE